jgi:hypothetical protein
MKPRHSFPQHLRFKRALDKYFGFPKLNLMEDTRPHQLTSAEWEEVMAVPEVKESWGIEANELSPADFANQVYGAKFNFVSGSPGYVGELFILQGDTLTGDAPLVLRRDSNGALIVL